MSREIGIHAIDFERDRGGLRWRVGEFLAGKRERIVTGVIALAPHVQLRILPIARAQNQAVFTRWLQLVGRQ